MYTALVTGAGGFLGRHLCSILAKEYNVIGAELPDVKPDPGLEWVNVTSDDGLAHLYSEISPEIVIHTAFINFKPPNFTDRGYLNKILAVNLPLFETISRIKGKLLLISSSAVYGKAEGRRLIDEKCPLRPVSLYGIAKMFQETLAQYYSNLGLNLSIVRLFNLIGPDQKRGMLVPDWVSRAQAVADGRASRFKVRHRMTSRDFVDVRDAAIAIALIVKNFKSREVLNVASGQAVSLLEISKELEKLSPVPLNIVEAEFNLSESDVLTQCGSFEKIKSMYGWRPQKNWQQSLKDVWESYST